MRGLWFDSVGEQIHVIVSFTTVPENLMEKLRTFSGEMTVFDFNTQRSVSGDWSMEVSNGSCLWRVRGLVDGHKEVPVQASILRGSPGGVKIAMPQSAWGDKDLSYFRSVRADTLLQTWEVISTDEYRFSRENPLVPNVGAPLVIVAIAVVAFLVRPKKNGKG